MTAAAQVAGLVSDGAVGTGALRNAGPAGRWVSRRTLPHVHERAELVAELGRSLSEPGGRALLLGEPGVGRSTVLTLVDHRAAESGARVLRIGADRSSADTPFLGLADLLSQMADDELDVLALEERKTLESVCSPRPGPVAVPHPLLLRLAVSRAVRAIQRSRPVLISIDDWTRLDAESADVLHSVVTRYAENGGPSLVATQVVDTLLSGRHRSIDHVLFPARNVHLVPPLSAPALAAVLEQWRGRVVPADLLLDLHQAVGGNPSWAMEVVSQPALHTHHGPVLPNSIAETVLSRVRLLRPEVQRVLAVCAATEGVPARTVAALAGTDALAVAAATEEGVVVHDDGHLVAAHPLLGAAALRLVGTGVQYEIHARAAAAATGPAERASHLDRASLPGPDEVIATALGAAAEQCWTEGLHTSAMTLTSRALARTVRGSTERAGRAVRLAEMAVALSSFDRAATVLGELDLACLAPALLDRALPLLVANITATDGDDAARATLAALAVRTDADTVRSAMIDVWRLSDSDRVPDRADRACRALQVLAAERELPRAQHRGLALLLTARLDAGHGLDTALLHRMRALEADLPTLPLLETADAAVARYGYEVDDMAASRVQLISLADRAERRGERAVAAVLRAHLAVVEVLSGRQMHAATLLESLDGTDAGRGGPLPIVARARASLALLRGDGTALEAALSPPVAFGTVLSGRIAQLVQRGAWAMVHERWAEAVPALSEAIELAAARGCDEPGRRLWADTMIGPGLVALGRLEEAGRIASHLESVARLGGRTALGGHALRLRGLLSAAAGDLDLAQAQLHGAADLIREGQMPGDHARCLLDLGRVLRRRRARKECGRVLRDVLAIAQQIGDRPLIALVEHELASSGRTDAPDVLTAAEERVAAAAARGLRNREIAAACFVSVRTVETQLTTVYRKLGVRSRVQLAARLQIDQPGRSSSSGGLPLPRP